MSEMAFAPEYQGSLRGLSVNTDYAEVLRRARADEARAEAAGEWLACAQAGLAVGEACRRLGWLADAEIAWKTSYRRARGVGSVAAMAWALWSGGTLARQRGQLDLALRWLNRGRSLAETAGDPLASGYALAGVAETYRIRGDFEQARGLHSEILAQARERAEPRHIVWALEGLGQIERNTGDLASARERFAEARRTAQQAGDQRGEAWALRGLADVVSLSGASEGALSLLSDGELLCRRMDLASALAYNLKMRGNVHYRAGDYESALPTYEDAASKFETINEPRGYALARLGVLKSRYRLGHDRERTVRELIALRDSQCQRQLAHTRAMIVNALADMGVSER